MAWSIRGSLPAAGDPSFMAASSTRSPLLAPQHARRCLHTSASRWAKAPLASDVTQEMPSDARTQSQALAAQKYARTPRSLRPNALTVRQQVFGAYNALLPKSDSSLERLTKWFAEMWITGQGKRAIANATGMSTLKAIMPSSSIDQQLREEAASIFFDMHKAISSNQLGHPRINANLKENFRHDISERRRKLLGNGYDYDLIWSCEQSEDDLIGNSAFRSSKHMSILGYRVGAAPVGMGDLSQIAQALVRFDTVQTMEATPKLTSSRYRELEPIKSGPQRTVEHYVFERMLSKPDARWAIAARVFEKDSSQQQQPRLTALPQTDSAQQQPSVSASP